MANQETSQNNPIIIGENRANKYSIEFLLQVVLRATANSPKGANCVKKLLRQQGEMQGEQFKKLLDAAVASIKEDNSVDYQKFSEELDRIEKENKKQNETLTELLGSVLDQMPKDDPEARENLSQLLGALNGQGEHIQNGVSDIVGEVKNGFIGLREYEKGRFSAVNGLLRRILERLPEGQQTTKNIEALSGALDIMHGLEEGFDKLTEKAGEIYSIVDKTANDSSMMQGDTRKDIQQVASVTNETSLNVQDIKAILQGAPNVSREFANLQADSQDKFAHITNMLNDVKKSAGNNGQDIDKVLRLMGELATDINALNSATAKTADSMKTMTTKTYSDVAWMKNNLVKRTDMQKDHTDILNEIGSNAKKSEEFYLDILGALKDQSRDLFAALDSENGFISSQIGAKGNEIVGEVRAKTGEILDAQKQHGEILETINNQGAELLKFQQDNLEALAKAVSTIDKKLDTLASASTSTMGTSNNQVASQETNNTQVANQTTNNTQATGQETNNTQATSDTQIRQPGNPFDYPVSGENTTEESKNTQTNESENKPEEEKKEPVSSDEQTSESNGSTPTEQTQNPTLGTSENKADKKAKAKMVSEDKLDKESKGKLQKVKLVRKAMDESRLLSEPKLPWYKRMFKFANNHPVLATLTGGAIGLGVTALTGPIFYMYMGLAGMLNVFSATLGSGALLGLGGGVLASAFSNRVLKGKKGRLYSKFGKLYGRCKKIDKFDDTLENAIDLSNQNAHEHQKKADKAKGFLKSVKRFAYRKARNFNMKKAGKMRVLKARNIEKRREIVEEALEVKSDLNRREMKANRNGKTKTLAIAGYMQKKKKLDEKFHLGKMSEEEYQVRLHDLDLDASELKGGQAGLSGINGKHRTFDKEAFELINSVKGKKSETMQVMLGDIANRHAKTEMYEEEYLDEAKTTAQINKLLAEGKKEEARDLEARYYKQALAIDQYKAWAKSKGLPEEPEITDAEEPQTTDTVSER